jgi:hypothetical protein
MDNESLRIEKSLENFQNNPHYRENNSFFSYVKSIAQRDLPEVFFYGYLYGGLYAQQLKNWFKIFPTNQFLILKSEDMFADPQHIVDQVCDFLDLEHVELKVKKKFNAREYDPMPKKIKEKLDNFYEPHNNELFKLLNRDFGWT